MINSRALEIKSAFLILCMSLLYLTGNAQISTAGRRDTSYRIPVGYYLAYNSSMIYPGAAAGINYPFRQFSFSKDGNNGRINKIYKERMFSLMLGYYHHPGFQDNLYLVPGWLMRRTKSSGLFFDFWAGLGYSRVFLGGTSYKVDAAGNVHKLSLAGYNYCMVAAGAGMGYDFTLKKKWPYSVFSRIDLLTMFPFNSTIYPRPAIELGVMYHPLHLFLTKNVAGRQVKKRRK